MKSNHIPAKWSEDTGPKPLLLGRCCIKAVDTVSMGISTIINGAKEDKELIQTRKVLDSTR